MPSPKNGFPAAEITLQLSEPKGLEQIDQSTAPDVDPKRTEADPKSIDVDAKNQAEDLDPRQSILEAWGPDITWSKEDDLDDSVTTALESPSVYLLCWAMQDWLSLPIVVLSFIIQMSVPAYIIVVVGPESGGLKVPEVGDAGHDVKFVTFLLTMYLISNFRGTMKRTQGIALVASVVHGKKLPWVIVFGLVALHSTVLLTTLSTFILFAQSPDIESILLNCVALSFIVDVDVSMVGFLDVLESKKLGTASKGAAKFLEVWGNSTEREDLVKSAESKTLAKTHPLFFASSCVGCAVGMLLLLAPILNCVCLPNKTSDS